MAFVPNIWLYSNYRFTRDHVTRREIYRNDNPAHGKTYLNSIALTRQENKWDQQSKMRQIDREHGAK